MSDEWEFQFPGHRLREHRHKAGLSLARLAEMAGVSKAYLVRLETDPKSNPSLEVLRRIASVLDVTVADLIGAPKLHFELDHERVSQSLRAFADQEHLTRAEVKTLASIRWRRGEEPRTPQRWRFILDSLRASHAFDEDKS